MKEGLESEAIATAVAQEQTDFFEKNGAFFASYAGDSSLEIKQSPQGLGTFAIDLEKGVMYAEPNFWEQAGGFGESDKVFATLHEFEHFKEMMEMINKKGGLAKFKKRKRFSILDNCVDDIKMNRSVIGRASALDETRNRLYEKRLFPEDDLSKAPKHLQFSQALLREAMLPNRQTVVSSDIRTEVERIKNIKSGGISLMDFITAPNTPMETRLKLQERFLEPVMEKFFKEDAAQKKKEKEEGEGDSGNGEGEDGEEGEGESEKEEKDKKNNKPQKSKKSSKNKPENSEDYFKNEYEEWDKKNPPTLPMAEIEKALKEHEKAKKEEKTPAELAEEVYAKAEGITAEELREYRKFLENLEEIKNPETDESVVEEIRTIFKKIIAERKKKTLRSKLPAEEGEILAFPAQAHIAVESGNFEPRVWETVDWKDKPKELFGEFDVTIVCDRSGSMERPSSKKIEQRKAAALVMEALKEFSDELGEEKPYLEFDLNVRSEIWTFGDDKQVEMLKPLDKNLTEKQRVLVYKTLENTPGDSTKDFSALEKIRDGVPAGDWAKIQKRKLKKLVIVLTDGDSDNPSAVQGLLREFREKGMVVIGVGITAEGASAKTTYAPDGMVCEKVEDLAGVLGNLLSKHIKELNTG